VATEPAISVVVATRDRRDRLPRLIDALAAQRDAPPFEVVIVDDGSRDGTFAELERLASATPFRLVPLRRDQSGGPGQARNDGWRRAQAPLIAFTDDDCAPQPEWLGLLAKDLTDTDAVQGRTIPDPTQLDRRNAFSHTVYAEGEWGFYEACNMAYRREVLEAHAGFDAQFQYSLFNGQGTGPIFGEDTDLAWRAKRSGARIVFDPNAVVFHEVRRQGYLEHLRGLQRYEGLALAMKRVPELRALCRHRVFWRPAHPRALLAAAGVAAAARRPSSPGRLLLAAALSVPYVRYRRNVAPLGGTRNGPAVIALAFLSDLVETAVLAAGSVRYRTVIL
jgi:glycosyltransferase involved in cell wall biosynthesis